MCSIIRAHEVAHQEATQAEAARQAEANRQALLAAESAAAAAAAAAAASVPVVTADPAPTPVVEETSSQLPLEEAKTTEFVSEARPTGNVSQGKNKPR